MTSEVRRFWQGRRVLVTGHTGFKGAWLALVLQRLGAKVSGIALPPVSGPSLFTALSPWPNLEHREIDLANSDAFAAAVHELHPEVVFHLAAQATVARGYREPALTFATNVTGTVHLLDALRGLKGVAAAVIVTSDKVYRNDATGRPFIETDPLGGTDPYSASKAAAEIAVTCWRTSFPTDLPAIATARAGNVIGGGDFGESRLIPDLVRAQMARLPLRVRHPRSTRPWQYVLDVLRGYMALAQALVQRPGSTPCAVNFGPHTLQDMSVEEVVALYEHASGQAIDWEIDQDPSFSEAPRLALDASLAASALGWRALVPIDAALRTTADWYGHWLGGDDLRRASLAYVDEAFP